jgi:hypothetical protein
LNCDIQKGLSLFPPNLKVLQVTSPLSRGRYIGNLPETLESFKCDAVYLKRSTEADFILPPRLLNLDVSRLSDSEEYERLPFNLSTTLLSLRISNMSLLQALPSLSVG